MKSVRYDEILDWYEKNPHDFPWRKDGISAYEVWVSEIMLQQTQVSRVVFFYARFLKRFPTIQSLSEARWEEFLPYYEGLGYYARGRNMLETARIVSSQYGGEFPRDKTLLRKLPGIGEYTASAILSFAYNESFIAYDTNFQRLFGSREVAEKSFKKSGVLSGVFNSAVMDYARAHPNFRKPKKGKKRDILFPEMVTVVLHENHKKYFSENRKIFQPFSMPKNVKKRLEIKKYFLEKYRLKVSVRPPNKSGEVNVQILSGRQNFAIFDKKGYDKWREKMISGD